MDKAGVHFCPYCGKIIKNRTKFCCRSHSMSYWNLKRSAEGTNVFLDSVKGKEIRSNTDRNQKISNARKRETRNFTHGWLQIETRAKSNKSSMMTYYKKLNKSSLYLYKSDVADDNFIHFGITALDNPKERMHDDRSLYKISNLCAIAKGPTEDIIELEYQLRVNFVTLDMVKLTHYYEWYSKADVVSIMSFIKKFSNSSETIQLLE